ncbi:response regulator [Sphingomonas sp. PAMC26645]|uniref:response regulator n=1 Tax=Sphingomonas sp. PAMC26645 TaxID=2565555 RepID=UPI00109DCFF7|nr:response regulator [Sphingomonas sp. PAMC26645]QCB41148.1 response regulator [Sphingomonas sp. PAMC26645]
MNHVLIIEDEPMIALAIQMALEDEGVTSFDVAATEQDAVALADEHLPTFITSDVALLEGTGPKAVATILGRHGSIPVLFLTGHPEDCVPVIAPAVVLTKPFNSRQVAMTYRALTNDKPA